MTLTAERIEERKGGIGGSDIGAIMGLNKWKSPVDVWLEKTGRLIPPDLSDNQRVHFGNVLEDVIAAEYARRNDVKVQRRRQMFTGRFPWMLANIDRKVVGERKVLECKSADAWTRGNWGESGTDEVPESYLVQVAWYEAVLDYNVGDLAVLIGGNDYRDYEIVRDRELEEMMIESAARFWTDHVLADVPPEPTSNHDLETLYAVENGKAIVATKEIEDTLTILKAVKEQKKAIEKREESLSIKVKAFIGENSEVILGPDGKKLASWKASKKVSYFLPASFKDARPDIFETYRQKKKQPRVLRLS